MRKDAARREFLKTAGGALTSSIFAGNLNGANDRITAAFIGTGRMGMSNLDYAMKQPGLEVTAVCDVCQPRLDEAESLVGKNGQQARPVKDFREILADKSIDIVCISTPDHWHAYMTVEACWASSERGMGARCDGHRRSRQSKQTLRQAVPVRRSTDASGEEDRRVFCQYNPPKEYAKQD